MNADWYEFSNFPTLNWNAALKILLTRLSNKLFHLLLFTAVVVKFERNFRMEKKSRNFNLNTWRCIAIGRLNYSQRLDCRAFILGMATLKVPLGNNLLSLSFHLWLLIRISFLTWNKITTSETSKISTYYRI